MDAKKNPRNSKPRNESGYLFIGKEVAEIFDVTPSAISQWPDSLKGESGMYDIRKVVKWWREKNDEKEYSGKEDLEKRKLELQNEKMQITIDDMKKKFIPIDDHNSILLSRAASFKNYWTETFMRNIHIFANKPVEVLRDMMERFLREAMNTYARTHK